MASFQGTLDARMDEARERGQRREIRARSGADFCSNDYLGFAESAELKQKILDRLRVNEIPVGAAGSRLLRGALDLHDRVEEDLARFSGRGAALLFPSGYQANIALLSSLLRPGDAVFSDEKNHASLIDGMRLAGAERKIYPHLDAEALDGLLARERPGKRLRAIVTESVFSMDGDVAPLRELARIAEKHSALLVVDEAHATGLWGRAGEGGGMVQRLELEREVFASIHTGGKALGAAGAWIACSRAFREYLVNFARPLLFSTAPFPFLAAALHEAVLFWRERGPSAVERLAAKVRHFRGEMGFERSDVPIIPVLFGANDRALQAAAQIQALGLDVRAIRPPTVPEGSARLRITLRADADEGDVRRLVHALRAAGGHA